MLLILVFTLLKFFKSLRCYKKSYCVILYLCVFLVFCVFPIACYFYDSILVNFELFKHFNHMVSGRLYWANEAICEYSIALLPRNIIFEKQNWVDSSIIAILIRYGLITYMLVAGLFLYFAYLISKKKDIIMAVIFIILLFHSVFDQELLLFEYNYFIFVWAYNNTSRELLHLD